MSLFFFVGFGLMAGVSQLLKSSNHTKEFEAANPVPVGQPISSIPPHDRPPPRRPLPPSRPKDPDLSFAPTPRLHARDLNYSSSSSSSQDLPLERLNPPTLFIRSNSTRWPTTPDPFTLEPHPSPSDPRLWFSVPRIEGSQLGQSGVRYPLI